MIYLTIFERELYVTLKDGAFFYSRVGAYRIIVYSTFYIINKRKLLKEVAK